MAIVKIPTGGRPIKIDTEQTLESLNRYIGRAKETLRDIRRSSSGYREARVLGTETSLPAFVNETWDALNELQYGGKLSLSAVRQVRQNIKTIKELASVQARVRERALSYLLEEQYVAEMSSRARGASQFTRKSVGRQIARVKNLSPRGKQAFFTSKKYQSPRSFYKRYKHIQDWANSKAEKERRGSNEDLNWEDSASWLMERRAQDGLSTDFDLR